MTILDKYIPNFEALDQAQAQYLAHAMHTPVEEPLAGKDLYEIYNEAGYDQADVVMSLANDPTVLGIQVVEALIGKPIVRRAPPAPKGARASSGPRKTVTVKKSDPRRIVFVSPTNPKREGTASWDRFNHYKVGMTIDEFVKAGGTMGDVKWDAERGFIKIEGDE